MLLAPRKTWVVVLRVIKDNRAASSACDVWWGATPPSQPEFSWLTNPPAALAKRDFLAQGSTNTLHHCVAAFDQRSAGPDGVGLVARRRPIRTV